MALFLGPRCISLDEDASVSCPKVYIVSEWVALCTGSNEAGSMMPLNEAILFIQNSSAYLSEHNNCRTTSLCYIYVSFQKVKPFTENHSFYLCLPLTYFRVDPLPIFLV